MEEKCKKCRKEFQENINSILKMEKNKLKKQKATIVIRTISITVSIMAIIISLILIFKN